MSAEPRIVIVVEDDASLGAAMSRILRLAGYTPAHYPSAEALLEKHDGVDATCLVLDLQLPQMDGFTLHERLCARGPVPPVIFITAFEDPETRARAAEGPGRGFLPKPFSGHALLDAIRRVVPQPAPHAAGKRHAT